MTEAEFNTQINRLASRWRAVYTPELVRLIWREVEKFSRVWLERTVDDFIGCCRQGPLMPEFRDAISKERERIWSEQKRKPLADTWKPNPDCDFCDDKGVYLCIHAIEPGFWAFRCHCFRGVEHPDRRIPQFKPDHAKEYRRYNPKLLKRPMIEVQPMPEVTL